MSRNDAKSPRTPYWVPASTAAVAIVAFATGLTFLVLLAALVASLQVYMSIRHIVRDAATRDGTLAADFVPRQDATKIISQHESQDLDRHAGSDNRVRALLPGGWEVAEDPNGYRIVRDASGNTVLKSAQGNDEAEFLEAVIALAQRPAADHSEQLLDMVQQPAPAGVELDASEIGRLAQDTWMDRNTPPGGA